MAKKVIQVRLGDSDIDRLIKEIEKYKADFQKKVDIYRNRIANEIAKLASRNFGSAEMDDKIRGGTRKPNVQVSVSDKGNISVVIADGEDAVWCEFGAGAYHNGSVGSSPNPYGAELGFAIGSYGKGYGSRKAWGYYEDGELVITRGTPASMPMYNAVQEIMKKVIKIAQEVFQ